MPEVLYADDVDPGGDPLPAIFDDIPVLDGPAQSDHDDTVAHQARHAETGVTVPETNVAYGASASGLSASNRAEARRIVAEVCHHLLVNPGALHYTQDATLRWEGINHRVLWDLHHGDCSSTHTWLLWHALHVHYKIAADLVNGQQWKAGYTGTILQHGKPVRKLENVRVGDAIVYGQPGSTGEHVATAMGGGVVFSHGSEGGPYLLKLDYRGDRMAIRRSI